MSIDAAFTTFPTLTTDRLVLRQIQPSDVNDFYAIKSNPDVMNAYGQEPHHSLDDTQAWLDRHRSYYAQRQGLLWCIKFKHHDSVIGSCLFFNFDANFYTAEIGYELHQDYWRQGIMAEAASAIINYGFRELGLHRVEALLSAKNAASKGVVTKLGFMHEGTLRQREYFRGQFHDLLYFGLLREEWQNQNEAKLLPAKQKLASTSYATLSTTDFERLMNKCAALPVIENSYLVEDFVDNLLLTVLDFQLRTTTVERAMSYFHQEATEITDLATLKNLLARYPDTQEGNRQAAQHLWGYNLWTRVEFLRRLITYFESQGVTTQAHLKVWAANADFDRDFKGKIKGLGYAIFQWLVMRQGVESIKPDVWVHRFIHEALGHHVSDEAAVAMLKEIALEMGIKAYELDWRIWTFQTGR